MAGRPLRRARIALNNGDAEAFKALQSAHRLVEKALGVGDLPTFLISDVQQLEEKLRRIVYRQRNWDGMS